MNLVIVESPAKAKTIKGYLGKDFRVLSSYGHVRDLPTKGMAIDIENDFAPVYEVLHDKKKIIEELKKACEGSDRIYLATDDDREGEAISWHLLHALSLLDSSQKVDRIVFREITKRAISQALASPRGIDNSLVDSQQARRVLDRLVGFELSPLLWKKVKRGLSAGRVQSVATRLVVEREREIESFESKPYYLIQADMKTEDKRKDGKSKVLVSEIFQAKYPSRLLNKQEVESFLESCASANFHVAKVERKPGYQSPSPPFTTSTLQQEASTKLGFSVTRTMICAQGLYESGHISYMRTDSLNLSEESISAAASEIKRSFGDRYSSPTRYSTRSKSAQEAHEAIRPTQFSVREAGKDSGERRLYSLIWKRAMASQMSRAILDRTLVDIGISTLSDKFLRAKGEVISFEGFLKVYNESSLKDDDKVPSKKEKQLLPSLEVGDILFLDKMESREHFTRPPARYAEASLVKHLDELGIGRPSTYAPTIDTIQKRKYVIKRSEEGITRSYQYFVLDSKGSIERGSKQELVGVEKNKLFPTDVALVVNDFLVERFTDILDYKFTARIEDELDEIAEGKISWQEMVGSFYSQFHPKVSESAKKEVQANTVRNLGTDPSTGKPVYAKLGRYGPYIQLGDHVDDGGDEKPRYVSLPKGKVLHGVTLGEALELLQLPRELGLWKEEPITVGIGPYGPYVRHAKAFCTLPEDVSPFVIGLDEAIDLFKKKEEIKRNSILKTFEEDGKLSILKGRYGPYIKYEKGNFRIPKGTSPEELSYEECLSIIQKAQKTKDQKT
ncbi:MAG: type I DNA topoisomerase [Cytophagales bacterium]|nr:type I DNA topoisomerase [Cytophagales bacterium]